MVRWDVERSPMSVQLLVLLGADHGLPAGVCLEGTGLEAESLRDTAAAVSARQELAVIENQPHRWPAVMMPSPIAELSGWPPAGRGSHASRWRP